LSDFGICLDYTASDGRTVVTSK